jgi:hypothetical protein
VTLRRERRFLLALGDAHDAEAGEAVDPAGGFGVGGVDELDETAVLVGEAGLHDRDDDLAGREGGLNFGAGVEDEVMVGACGTDRGVQDEGVGFGVGDEAGLGEDFGEKRAGVGFFGVGVAIADVDGGHGHVGQVGEGEVDGAALEGDGEEFGGCDHGLAMLHGMGGSGMLGRHGIRLGAGGEGDGGEGKEEGHCC